MPVAMEKALERVANKRGLTGKERDAFVYGTMRKTGWKPKREVDKKPKSIAMKTRLDRLIELNDNTSELMEFKKVWDPETETWVDDGRPSAAANLAVGAGVLGVGGYAGHRAIDNAGGYGAVARRGVSAVANNPSIKRGVDYAAKVGTQAKYARNLAGTLKSSPMALVKDLLKRVKGVRFESREQRIISLNSKLNETLQFGIDSGVLKVGGILGGVIAGGNIGRLASKKKYNRTTGQWEDASGKPTGKINWPAEASSLAGGGAVIAGIHAAPTVKRKASATRVAISKTINRANADYASGFEPRVVKGVTRIVKSAYKAARYA